MSLPSAAQQALAAFAGEGSWEQRARLLMQWGEHLPALSDSERNDANLIRGCASPVWLVAQRSADSWQLRAASDARLLRGLLALLLVRLEGLSGAELAEVDLQQWFTELGLARQLSPSRSNGLNAVLQRVQALVNQA